MEAFSQAKDLAFGITLEALIPDELTTHPDIRPAQPGEIELVPVLNGPAVPVFGLRKVTAADIKNEEFLSREGRHIRPGIQVRAAMLPERIERLVKSEG